MLLFACGVDACAPRRSQAGGLRHKAENHRLAAVGQILDLPFSGPNELYHFFGCNLR
jgi:hypothetical protein